MTSIVIVFGVRESYGYGEEYSGVATAGWLTWWQSKVLLVLFEVVNLVEMLQRYRTIARCWYNYTS